MERAKRRALSVSSAAARPEPRIGRKDLQDPDRKVPEPGLPAPGDEQGQSDPDAGAGRPMQLEIPATE
jgi:hypothetical protein